MHYLKAGEIVRDTDEVSVTGFGWLTGSLNVGKKLPADKVGLYRRPGGRILKSKKRRVRQTRASKLSCRRATKCSYFIVAYCGKKTRCSRLGCYKPSKQFVIR
jgi:hypothetical protein